MLYRCRLLLYSGRYGATNRWYQEFKLLHGDYFEKSFQRVREQVSTLSTLKNIVLGVVILKMNCICYFCALFQGGLVQLSLIYQN
jgi:hypothetical protein